MEEDGVERCMLQIVHLQHTRIEQHGHLSQQELEPREEGRVVQRPLRSALHVRQCVRMIMCIMITEQNRGGVGRELVCWV